MVELWSGKTTGVFCNHVTFTASKNRARSETTDTADYYYDFCLSAMPLSSLNEYFFSLIYLSFIPLLIFYDNLPTFGGRGL
jgi:hypothetical protein